MARRRGDGRGRPLPPERAKPRWVLVQHDDPKLATLLILNDPFATDWRAKRRGIRLRDLRDGEAFHGAIQADDALVTAYDQDALALAAFRPADRQLLADMAGALVAGRLAFADGGEGTLQASIEAGFERVTVRATGPTGEPVDAARADACLAPYRLQRRRSK